MTPDLGSVTFRPASVSPHWGRVCLFLSVFVGRRLAVVLVQDEVVNWDQTPHLQIEEQNNQQKEQHLI